MTISRAIFNQVRAMIRPLETKVANIAARVVVKIISDTGTRQTAQVDGLPTETLDGVQHFVPYGLISVPRAGAEGVMLFVDGDRGHPLLFAVDDRAARPTGGAPGDTGLYHFDGAQIRLTSSGDILITPKAGQKVLVSDGSGSLEPLVKKSEFDGHTHVPGTFATVSGPVTGLSGGATAVAGTGDLEAS